MVQAILSQRSTTSSQLFIFGLCLLFRFINAHFTRTFDNPDEYWQAQEVAHHLVFGHGYLTWEWREKIRSFAHPLVFSAIYKLVQIIRLDHTILLVAAPKYLQATLAAVADFATYALAKKVIGNQIALPILFTTLCSWFNFSMAARSLSNSMEMVFTIVALNYWPLPGIAKVGANKKTWLQEYRISLVLALLACIMRPTNGLIWLFLGIHLILAAKGNRIKVIFNAAVISFLVILANSLLDTHIYTHILSNNDDNNLIFTPFQFFKVNVINNISLFYGVHTWHWYISQGLPFILTTFLPLTLFGLYSIYIQPPLYHRMKPLLFLSAWVVSIYSLLPHKEFRFLYPIVPLLLIITAYGLAQLPTTTTVGRGRARMMAIVVFLVLTQILMAVYGNVWHQRGVLDVMLWIRKEAAIEKKSNRATMSVGVLMPCHSTPWYSVVHENIPMWFLTCEPPLHSKFDGEQFDYEDETDLFYKDPNAFLKGLNTDKGDKVWPTSHLVLFDNLVPQVGEALERLGYVECRRFFNSHFHDDKRRRGDVVVLCLRPDQIYKSY